MSPAANSATEGSDSGNAKCRSFFPQEGNASGVVEIDYNDADVSTSYVSKPARKKV